MKLADPDGIDEVNRLYSPLVRLSAMVPVLPAFARLRMPVPRLRPLLLLRLHRTVRYSAVTPWARLSWRW